MHHVHLPLFHQAFTPPVLYTANGSISLFGDAGLDTSIGQVSVGQQLAGYYSPRQGVTQVYDYATNQSGFFPTALLNAPASPAKTYTKVVRLKSDRTATYTLSLPAGFTPGNVNPTGTAIDYSLYRGNAIGTGTGMAINATGRGNHSTFLNATVVRSTYNSKTVTVTVKTGKLGGSLTPAHRRQRHVTEHVLGQRRPDPLSHQCRVLLVPIHERHK